METNNNKSSNGIEVTSVNACLIVGWDFFLTGTTSYEILLSVFDTDANAIDLNAAASVVYTANKDEIENIYSYHINNRIGNADECPVKRGARLCKMLDVINTFVMYHCCSRISTLKLLHDRKKYNILIRQEQLIGRKYEQRFKYGFASDLEICFQKAVVSLMQFLN